MYGDILYDTAMTATQRKSHFKLTTDTPYLALMGELLGVCHGIFNKIYGVTTASHCIMATSKCLLLIIMHGIFQ